MLDTILGANPDLRRVQSRFARALFRAGISANLATILAAIAGIASGIAFARAHATFAIVALVISAAFDALDGTIARECAAPSPLGGVLDLSADRVVEACVIVGIAWRDPALYFPALILVATWYVNITIFLSVGAALEGPSCKIDRVSTRNSRTHRGDNLLHSLRHAGNNVDNPPNSPNALLCDGSARDSHRRTAPAIRPKDVATAMSKNAASRKVARPPLLSPPIAARKPHQVLSPNGAATITTTGCEMTPESRRRS